MYPWNPDIDDHNSIIASFQQAKIRAQFGASIPENINTPLHGAVYIRIDNIANALKKKFDDKVTTKITGDKNVIDFLSQTMKRVIDVQQDMTKLDLSDLKSKGVQNLNELSWPLVLFFAAAFARTKANGDSTTELDLSNNKLDTKNTRFLFTNIKKLFTNLISINLSGNQLPTKPRSDPGITFILDEKAATYDENVKSFAPQPHKPKLEAPIYSPKLQKIPLEINQKPNLNDAYDSITLESFEVCRLDPNDFPINSFLTQFLSDSWTNLKGIGQYYADDSFFSASSAKSFDNSPLSSISQHTTNKYYDEPFEKLAFGQKLIVFTQIGLFGTGFYAHPTRIHSSCLDDDHFITVIEGGFRDVSLHIYRFERTLIIKAFDYSAFSYQITNDQIFISAPTHCKLSGFNPSEAGKEIRELSGLQQKKF